MWTSFSAEAGGESPSSREESITEEKATDVAIRVSNQFAAIVQRETQFRAVTLPIRPKPTLLPKYVLELFTRNAEGLWCFADVLGQASLDWHQAWLAEEEDQRLARDGDQGVLDIFADRTWRFDPEAHEALGAPTWIATIAKNIKHIIGQGPFRLYERTLDVYGPTLGVAWGKHVRRAVKNLYKAGVITNTGVGPHYYRQVIEPFRVTTGDAG